MKSSCILFCLLFSICCLGQNQALLDIIDSHGDKAQLQKRIDSLTSLHERNMAESDLAEFYHDLGSKWYIANWWEQRDKKDMKMALLYTEKSLALKRQLPGLKEESLEKTLFNLAFFHYKNEEIYKAIELYKSLVRDHDGSLKRDALFELGLCYSITGEFFKALKNFDDFILSFEAKELYGENDKLFIVDGYVRKAETYSRMGHRPFNTEIRNNLMKADSILKQISTTDNYYSNTINQLEGNRLMKNENFPQAITRYQKILKDSANLIPADLAIVYNSLGKSQRELKNYNAAFSTLKKGITKYPHEPDLYRSLGLCFSDIQDFDKAMKNYQKAIDLSIDKDRTTSYQTLPNIAELEFANGKVPLIDHIVSKAHGWIAYYKYDGNLTHLEKALNTFTLADELIDLVQFDNTEERSKYFWREKSSRLYGEAIETCFLLERPKKAFYFIERNKALLLLEDISNEEAKEIANLPSEIAQREYDLKRTILLSENKLQEQINQDSLVVIKQTIRSKKYHYENFIDSLEKSYPDYAKFKKKVNVLSLESLRNNFLSDKKTALHYLLDENKGYGLLTAKDTMALFKIDEVPKLNEEVDSLIAGLSNGATTLNKLQRLSKSVFQKLFPLPIYKKIRGKQVTIVPDYTLQRIPFESLVVDSKKMGYLIQESEIGYTYSFSLLQQNRNKKKESDIDFLGVAPIVFDQLQLPELYFSEKEVNNVANIFPGETLVNGKASKVNFIEKAGKPSILHLATHADIGDGENPWIAFNDSKMYLKEIYATKTNADMVVLSGCNTSSGALKKGEGVMSLARGFFYSGAKSVVSTLWQVEDQAGKDILTNFYKNLDNGLTKSKALQKAKLDYLANTEEEELKHPYYWAAFVVLGDNSAIGNEADMKPWMFVVLGVLGIGMVVLVHRKSKRKQAAA